MTQPTPPSMHPSDALPPPPRPITPAALRQSRRELSVRVWVLITVGVLVVLLAVASQNIAKGLSDRRLLREGIPLEATIELIYGGRRNIVRSISRDLKISYQVPGESTRRLVEHTMLTPVHTAGEPGEEERGEPITLTPRHKFMNPGDRIPIRVDRKDPRVWTDRVDPDSWLVTLAVPLMLAPVVALLLWFKGRQRAKILRVFRDGVVVPATVVEVQRSALVPGQRVVKVAPAGANGRVLPTTLPDAVEPRAREQTVDVIADDAADPKRVLLAAAYL